MKKKLVYTAVAGALTLGASVAHATNGDQMLGFSAIQWGMAGAVVAAPQDAATILTNPAGIAELDIEEVRFDLGVGVMNPPRSTTHNGTEYESDSDYYMMPGGGVSFKLSDRMYFGMGMGGQSGSGVDFADTNAAGSGNQTVVTTKQHFKVAPGISYKITDGLSLGGTVNLNYLSLAMYMPQPLSTQNLSLPQAQTFGYGVTLGGIYRINDRVQLGASWSNEQEMDELKWNTTAGKVSMQMNGAPQYAVGAAFRPADGLLVELDVKQIMFSEVLDVVYTKNYTGNTNLDKFNFGWDDQTVYSLGIQKQLGKTTLRAGYNYGESPIGPEDVNTNVGSLAVIEKHATLGLTRQLTKGMYGSFSYAHGFENEVTSTDGTRSIALEQKVFNIQVSYKH